jgi:hypothetical protein
LKLRRTAFALLLLLLKLGLDLLLLLISLLLVAAHIEIAQWHERRRIPSLRSRRRGAISAPVAVQCERQKREGEPREQNTGCTA